MSRTFLVGLALIGLAACGGSKGHPGTTHSRSATTSRSAATRRATTTKTKAQRKTAARPDTGQRNPLTNH